MEFMRKILSTFYERSYTNFNQVIKIHQSQSINLYRLVFFNIQVNLKSNCLLIYRTDTSISTVFSCAVLSSFFKQIRIYKHFIKERRNIKKKYDNKRNSLIIGYSYWCVSTVYRKYKKCVPLKKSPIFQDLSTTIL